MSVDIDYLANTEATDTGGWAYVNDPNSRDIGKVFNNSAKRSNKFTVPNLLKVECMMALRTSPVNSTCTLKIEEKAN